MNVLSQIHEKQAGEYIDLNKLSLWYIYVLTSLTYKKVKMEKVAIVKFLINAANAKY